LLSEKVAKRQPLILAKEGKWKIEKRLICSFVKKKFKDALSCEKVTAPELRGGG